MGQVVYLTGAPATGKSTLTHHFLSMSDKNKVFEYGQELKKFLKNKGIDISSQTELREKSAQIVTLDDKNSLDQSLIEFVNANRDEFNIIVDSHAVTKEVYGFRITAFSSEQFKKLNPTYIVVLYTDSKTTINRIMSNSQGRPLPSAFEADLHTYLQSSVAINYSMLSNTPILFVDSTIDTKLLYETLLERISFT